MHVHNYIDIFTGARIFFTYWLHTSPYMHLHVHVHVHEERLENIFKRTVKKPADTWD